MTSSTNESSRWYLLIASRIRQLATLIKQYESHHNWTTLVAPKKVVEHRSPKASKCTIYLPCFQNVLGISKISFQIAAECTNQRPYYQKFSDCGQPTSHPLYEINTCAVFLIAVIIHAKASLFQNDLCSTISFQIPSKYTIYRPCFHFFCSSEWTIHRPCFHFFLQFQIVSNTASQNGPCTVCILIFSVVHYCFRCRRGAPISIIV